MRVLPSDECSTVNRSLETDYRVIPHDYYDVIREVNVSVFGNEIRRVPGEERYKKYWEKTKDDLFSTYSLFDPVESMPQFIAFEPNLPAQNEDFVFSLEYPDVKRICEPVIEDGVAYTHRGKDGVLWRIFEERPISNARLIKLPDHDVRWKDKPALRKPEHSYPPAFPG